MLEWQNDRWHLDGKGIHAGTVMEMRWPDGTWEAVRIESSDRGRVLIACFKYRGENFSVLVARCGSSEQRDIRWTR